MNSRSKASIGIGIALIVVYSIIMSTSGGDTASWAWLLLGGGVALLVVGGIGARRNGNDRS